ncbi:MAG: glycosyltransferase family 1 protein [Candidatus Andersenbacteria bacterium]
MKIGIDIRSLTDPQLTGVGTYTRAIVRAMQQVAPDLQFSLYASGTREQTLTDLGIPNLANTSLTWNRRPNKLLSARSTLTRAPYLDRIVGGVDVWFSPNVNFTALSPHVPHVLTVHDVSYALYPDFFSLKRRLWHNATRARRLIQQATHVICDSRSTAQDVTRLYAIPAEQLTVVPLGASLAEPPTPDESAAAQKKYELPKRYIVAIGAIEPRKNLAALVRAFDGVAQRDPDLGLALIGPLGWKTATFERAVAQSPVADRILVLGYVPESAKRALLAGATALYCASSYEGFGLPALEALQLGVPVLTANISSLPEVTGHAAVLVDPERPVEIERALELLLSEPGLRTQLADAGLPRAQGFSWHRAARQTVAVLRAVAEQGVGVQPVPVAAEVL